MASSPPQDSGRTEFQPKVTGTTCPLQGPCRHESCNPRMWAHSYFRCAGAGCLRKHHANQEFNHAVFNASNTNCVSSDGCRNSAGDLRRGGLRHQPRKPGDEHDQCLGSRLGAVHGRHRVGGKSRRRSKGLIRRSIARAPRKNQLSEVINVDRAGVVDVSDGV